MIEIVQNGHSVLRQISKSVDVDTISSNEIKKVLLDMKEALDSQEDGVAIAAPQIGIPLRIFIVSGKIFDSEFVRGKKSHLSLKVKEIPRDLVCINPVFKKISSDRKLLSEGCLSVRPIYGKVRRATRATIEAYDENGDVFVKDGSGLLAHIFQHEIDHLDGILFIDKARDLHESTSEEEYSLQK
jgi:peptide deformylase